MINSKSLKNLETSYIIFKKVSGYTYYYRRGYSQCTLNASRATVFDSLNEANKVFEELKTTRKAKFKLEKASKHFVSSFKMSPQLFWADPSVNIHNSIYSLTEMKNNRINLVHDVDSTKDSIIVEIDYKIGSFNQRKEDRKKEYEQNLESLNKYINALNELKNEVINTNFNQTYVEPNLTQADRTMSILYGAKNGNS